MKLLSFGFCMLFLLSSCNSSNKKLAQKSEFEKQDFSEGKQVYEDFCMQCHMANGKGVPRAFPPLAKSDYLKNKREASIKAIKYGLSGSITVNGKVYNSNMAPQGLSNKEIADVMNYITNSWGNENTSLITEEEVSKIQR
ncbi:cytochrome c [Lacinutrix sp. MedPE-SW]|uniref:c-type cytochrome n=1 Tax=Lacinutrix sp. MedPE-SW TaxID=1860087 RepID=UPI0025BA5AE9|nr:cytochrome c [Lacinutrix sp. MedPE-SW]